MQPRPATDTTIPLTLSDRIALTHRPGLPSRGTSNTAAKTKGASRPPTEWAKPPTTPPSASATPGAIRD